MFTLKYFELLSIISATILFGILDSFWRPLILKYGHIKVLLHRTILTVIIFTFLKAYFKAQFVWDLYMISITIISGIIATLGLFCLTKAFQLNNTSTIVFLNIFTLIFGQFFSFLFFREIFDIYFYSIEIFLSIISLLLLNQGSFSLDEGIKFGLLASFCFGLAYPMMGIPIKVLGSFNSSFIQEIVVLLGVFLLSLNNAKRIKLDSSLFRNHLLILLSLFTVIALLLHFYSYEFYPVHKINLISNFYPVVAMMSAVLFYKEKLKFIQFLGALLAMISTVFIISN